ncbi:MAG TPA: ABC transporter permease [Gaiella sp.]|nr:ABC transporter permease [Gaiella sp.]
MSTIHEEISLPVDTAGAVGGEAAVKARGYWEGVWLRLKRDRFALAGGAFIIFMFLVAFVGAPIAAKILGHGPNDQFYAAVDADSFLPVGPMTWVETPDGGKTLFILGADSTIGRDLFLRLLYGARTSLEVAVFATLFSVGLGVLLGALAGYFRGSVDTVVSRLSEIVMAFPGLLFIIAISAIAGEQLNGITFGVLAPGVFTLVLVFSLLGWFYPARIVRGQVLSLREKEFVEAARMTGASDWRIVRSHLLPHLVGPVIVYATLIVASLVIAEAGLSFLGLGIQEPTASWGNILAQAPQYYLTVPSLMIWPGLAILLATLAFNLLGDGLRDAFDPRKTG